ncbi:hypothetical protein BXZ70DRAFT_309402 [Cristinia sonorae]|uniref:Uncharacterized protein n=1 Tax=Cristinia sonorae TaxID=1940300 RepID=A0A8K0UKU1_9AGAR|nr:hypothetical protein BXZ70DRAFT_309402 [Cristinia sonorae]
MGSYYRDNISFDSPQHHQSTFHAHDGQQQPSTSLQDSGSSLGPTRLCSVRGCTAVLPFEYSLKMCEQCRGRHRIYANTKRQKRKLEKLALGGQQGSVVWMPPDDQVDHTEEHADLQPAVEALQQPAAPEPIPPATPISEPQPPAQILAQAQQFNIPPPPTQWDNSAIDPRLFSQTPASSSSELAGALNFPGMNPTTPPQPPRTTHVSPQQVQQQAYIQQTLSTVSPSSVQSTPQALPFSPQLEPKPLSEPSHTSVPQAPPSLPFGSNVAPHVEISARAISEAAAHMPDPNLPHRYCSIKGCKAVIPGDSFFKMCEPCRNRYRNYGTTKRAKWRREKEVAVAELQNLRMEEDKRRAEHGLPPLPREEIEWQDIPVGELGSAAHATRSPFAQVVQSHTPRMCTVSHCREILPPDYEYLRCERHRVQNRHHSKLKRVRDKESKAVAFDDWAAAVNAMAQKNEVEEGLPSEEEDGEGEEERDNLEGGVASGVPPAARGSRRTNHVCSIKDREEDQGAAREWDGR